MPRLQPVLLRDYELGGWCFVFGVLRVWGLGFGLLRFRVTWGLRLRGSQRGDLSKGPLMTKTYSASSRTPLIGATMESLF